MTGFGSSQSSSSPVLLSNLSLKSDEDKSEEFEQTDTAIEKSVNLAFDFMAHGVFDSAFDFGKFLFQIAAKKK